MTSGEDAAAAILGAASAHEKCTLLFALSVARTAKFLSSQLRVSQYFAGTALRRKENRETKSFF